MRQIWSITALGLLLLFSGCTAAPAGQDSSGSQAPQAVSTAPSTPSATPSPAVAPPTPTVQASAPQAGDIGEARAKEIALAQAGLEADQVTFLKSRQDWEDGRLVYDIEFYDGSAVVYEYEIAADDGTVLSMDRDTERDQSHHADGMPNTMLSQDQAMEIALAQVPGADRQHITKWELDRDDGRQIYEIEIYFDRTEYEFEIDAYSGGILKQSSERD